MKRQALKIFAIAIVTTIISCADEKTIVKEFAVNFGTQVSKNQIDSVRLVYPDAAKCDSLALRFNADSIVVMDTDKSNVFTVDFGSDATITIEKAEDSKMTVTSSKGLFAYPADELSLVRT